MALDAMRGGILVVDGDMDARGTYQALLEHAGYPSIGASDAADAQRITQMHEPALTILDVVLPDGNGLTLLQSLQTIWPSMPAIVVTHHAESWRVVEAMRAGAFDYLTKPVDSNTLLSACQTALTRRGGAVRAETRCPSEHAAAGLWSAACGHLRPLREIEDAYIDHVLAATGGNRTRAARILGVARETLRTRMLTRKAAS